MRASHSGEDRAHRLAETGSMPRARNPFWREVFLHREVLHQDLWPRLQGRWRRPRRVRPGWGRGSLRSGGWANASRPVRSLPANARRMARAGLGTRRCGGGKKR
jgi:hypothetical protein